MLLCLSIHDVVLIDRLDLSFPTGLSALTGETGAGKSILLDSLGLALGARSDALLVRKGARQLSVTAEFELPADHAAMAILSENEIEPGDSLILKRVVGADGRSRAFANDQPISVGLMRRLGETLVEIHGQFESHTLLDPATHLGILDAFGRIDAGPVHAAWAAWRDLRKRRADAESEMAKARAEEEFLRHAAEELAALSPRPGEESELAEKRAAMMHGEKLIEAMNQAMAGLAGQNGAEAALRDAERALIRVADKAQGLFDGVMAALDRAAIETAEAQATLERISSSIDLDPKALETAEERLFALRALARKHGVAVDDLAALLRKFSDQLAELDAGGGALSRLTKEEEAAKKTYAEAAKTLSAARATAAAALDRAIAAELPPLKLDRARFFAAVRPLPEADWTENGADSVSFEVATNAGSELAPLARVASGGELSRLMLALKVVLAHIGSAGTIVFDEVDNAVGGAVAAAVGERLARLGRDLQVLVVTHSPQVAARAGHQWMVSKGDDGSGGTVTRVTALDDAARREEIARMLSGAAVTDQARAAAAALLDN